MFLRKVGRLPVIGEGKELIGIIAKKDIFKAIVGRQIPYRENEEYHDWIAKKYDQAIDWDKRLAPEVSSLDSVFKKLGVKSVLDIGSGTGEHAIALARKGYRVLALENSRLMHEVALEKWNRLPKALKSRLTFKTGDYTKLFQNIDAGDYRAAIFMGNTLAYHPKKSLDILKGLQRILGDKGIIIAQVINAHKAIKVKNRLINFQIGRKISNKDHEQIFLWFYDPPRKSRKSSVLNAAVFEFDGKIWTISGMNYVETAHFTKSNLENLFKKLGYKPDFYGTKKWGMLFKERLSLLEHDWINVLARL